MIGNWIVSEPSRVDDNPAFDSAPVPEAEYVQNDEEICDPSDNEEGWVLEEEVIQELPSKSSDETVTKAASDLSTAQEKKSYASIVSSKYTQFFYSSIPSSVSIFYYLRRLNILATFEYEGKGC